MEEDGGDIEETSSLKLKVSKKHNLKSPLIVTHFSNSNHLKIENGSELKFESYKKPTDERVDRSAERQLSATNGRLTYAGLPNSDLNSLQYFVGVRNKRTGKMKLFDASIFFMKPILKAVQESASAASTPSKTYWEGVNDLTNTFGSKTRKRALNSRIKSDVQMSLEEMKIEDSLSLRSSPDRTSESTAMAIEYLPPINHEAITVQEVFNIHDIISPEEEYALEEHVSKFINLTHTSDLKEVHSNFVKSRLLKLDKINIKYLIYYDYLICFEHLRYKDIVKKDPIPSMPQPIKGKILDNFTITSKSVTGKKTRNCPKQMKDKLIAYILVLALFIDNFCVELKDVLCDLSGIKLPKLVTVAQAVGCHVRSKTVEGENMKIAELKIPLYKFGPRLNKRAN